MIESLAVRLERAARPTTPCSRQDGRKCFHACPRGGVWTILGSSDDETMTKYCTALRCQEMAAGFSTLCHNHKQIQRRHGDPAQTGVTVFQLRPYTARVVARQAKNADNESWDIVRGMWASHVAEARRDIEAAESGAAFVRHRIEAARQAVHLADAVSADDVMRTALAMYLYREDQPRRFRSDRAFDFQLVRRVRGLSAMNAGSYWDNKEKRSRRVYKDMPPRVVEALAALLKGAFGLAGVMLARKEQAELYQAGEERARLGRALEAMS